MSTQIKLCSYSGYKIYPGHGKRMVKADGKVFTFLNSKCERSHLMRRNPRKITWTVLYRRQHKRTKEEEHTKKRSRRIVKAQRPIVGASLAEILAKRNQKPEVRKAQREQAERALREKKMKEKKAKAKERVPPPKVASKMAKTSQKAPKQVMPKAPRIGGKR